MSTIHPWLSNTSKMPGYSFSIPAVACPVGSKLVDVPGTVCSKCYALKGHYMFPKVQQALRRRHDAFTQDSFVDEMSALLKRVKCKYFRWFDSGDLPTACAIEKIDQIARNVPDMQFWLPTKQHKWVTQFYAVRQIPENLVIRLSSLIIGGRPPKTILFQTSTTHKKGSEIHGYKCPAPDTNGRCGECRACWNPRINNVSYGLH